MLMQDNDDCHADSSNDNVAAAADDDCHVIDKCHADDGCCVDESDSRGFIVIMMTVMIDITTLMIVIHGMMIMLLSINGIINFMLLCYL